PKYESVRSSLFRTRWRQLQTYRPAKKDFMVPDNLQKTLDGQRFLAFDVDIGSRMLGFCSHEGLFRLSISYGIQLSPATIMTDFEDGAIQAFQTRFPNAKCLGCHFHFCNCLWKKAGKLHLRNILNNDGNKHFLASLFALPLIPKDHIQFIFDDFQFNVPQYLNIVRFIKYVEKNINGAIFSPDIWNLFDFIGLRTRTNNPIEDYHNKQNR
ncbi:unnamed protein product, partial [Didymodactylos carnosus]